MSETMMLSKKYNPDKLQLPCYASEKLDGVPVVIGVFNGSLKAMSRQGNEITSIYHILEELGPIVMARPEVEYHGELYIRGKDFKDISGLVRRHREQCEELTFNMFDCFVRDEPDMTYGTRLALLKNLKSQYLRPTYSSKVITTYYCETLEELTGIASGFAMYAEGTMVRSKSGTFRHGKRSWDMMKIKVEPTMDLKVVGLIEAMDKHKKPTGRLGSFECMYKGKKIKIGAGCMKHNERMAVWISNHDNYIGKIIEVKYMINYASLRLYNGDQRKQRRAMSEEEESVFSHHEECAECGSSDAKAIYTNGSSKCYKCDHYIPPPKEELETTSVEGLKDYAH